MSPSPNLLHYWDRFADIFKARNVVRNWWDLTVAYASKDDPEREFTAVLRSGDRMFLKGRHEVAVFWHIFVRECYEVRPTDRFIVDAGANIGLFATWAARHAPQARLLCVEPHPATYSRLLKTVQDLGVADRVDAVQSALGGDSEPRWLGDSAGGDSTESHLTNRQSPKGHRVACTTLAGLSEQRGWDAVDLLKVDIEGSEYETLLSAPEESLRRISRINVEFHVPDERAARQKTQLLERLSGIGFRVTGRNEDSSGYGVFFFEKQAYSATPQ